MLYLKRQKFILLIICIFIFSMSFSIIAYLREKYQYIKLVKKFAYAIQTKDYKKSITLFYQQKNKWELLKQ